MVRPLLMCVIPQEAFERIQRNVVGHFAVRLRLDSCIPFQCSKADKAAQMGLQGQVAVIAAVQQVKENRLHMAIAPAGRHHRAIPVQGVLDVHIAHIRLELCPGFQSILPALHEVGEIKHSLEMIAGLCGFSGANYLCRVFKRETGLSPAAWRETAAHKAVVQKLPARNNEIYV